MNLNYEKLPKDWQKILANKYLEGASDVEVRAELRMTDGVWDSLYGDPTSSEFREIVDFGHTLAKAWWLAKARTNLTNRNFNTALFTAVMKNQYGWSDKSTLVTKTAADLSDDELNERIKEVYKKLGKTKQV